MRFEIRGGGITAILVSVALLSCAVFVLGLLAGYDVGREAQISSADVATTYPLQPPPGAVSQPNNAAPVPAPAATLEAASAPPSRVPAPIRGASSQPPNEPARKHVASADLGPSGPLKAPPPPPEAEAPEAVPPSERTAALENPPPRPLHRHPYNIQIQAAMDLGGANQMIRRLRQLGYTPHLVPTDISGERWYKVEVGPYATQEEAVTAEAQLRQKYNATYGGGAQPAQPANPDSDSE